jgi:hypothetical protein
MTLAFCPEIETQACSESVASRGGRDSSGITRAPGSGAPDLSGAAESGPTKGLISLSDRVEAGVAARFEAGEELG